MLAVPPGFEGDAFTYSESRMRRKRHAGTWLGEVEEDIEDCTIKPYIVGDGAFPMKSHDQPDYELTAQRINKAGTKEGGVPVTAMTADKNMDSSRKID